MSVPVIPNALPSTDSKAVLVPDVSVSSLAPAVNADEVAKPTSNEESRVTSKEMAVAAQPTLSVRVSRELAEDFRAACAGFNETPSDILRALVTQFVSFAGKKDVSHAA